MLKVYFKLDPLKKALIRKVINAFIFLFPSLIMLIYDFNKPRSCAQFAPGSKFTPGAPPSGLGRVYMPIICVHTDLNLLRNLRQCTLF